MDDELEECLDGENDSSNLKEEPVSDDAEIERRLMHEMDIDEFHFELKEYIEGWMQKFPAGYWVRGTLIFQIKNYQVGSTIHSSKGLETGEIMKIMASDL
jgi:hypothetical protein